MASNLTGQVRNIADVATADRASGDLSRKITVDVKGEILELKNTINTMVDQLNGSRRKSAAWRARSAPKASSAARRQVPGVAGTWKDLTDNVNSMASNLTGQVRNIADVATAIANGDLSRKITVDVKGEILRAEEHHQHDGRSAERLRVGSEPRGARGRHRRQARRPGARCRGVAGTWKDLTDNVNSMASNLTGQVRNIADVATAVANGDLSRKITVDVKGEILELKNTINTMVDQLNAFASEVTRVAREVGTEGKLGGQARRARRRRHVEGPHRQRQLMASNLTGQVRNIAEVATAVARGDLSRKITVDVKGEILELKNTINTMVDQLNAFASEVSRVAREVGTEGKLGGQAQVPGVAGTWKDLTDNVNSMAGNLTPGAQHRRGDDRRRQRRPVEEDHRRRARRDPAAEGHHQHDGGPAALVRRRSDARGARSRHRRQARRPGRGARRRRHLEGPDRQRQLDGVEPDRPGAQHRRRRDRRSRAATCRARSRST